MVGGVGALGGSDEVLCGVEVGGFAGAWGANFGGALLARECELEGEVWICEGEGGGEGGGCGGVRPRSLAQSALRALCARSLGSLGRIWGMSWTDSGELEAVFGVYFGCPGASRACQRGSRAISLRSLF